MRVLAIRCSVYSDKISSAAREKHGTEVTKPQETSPLILVKESSKIQSDLPEILRRTLRPPHGEKINVDFGR